MRIDPTATMPASSSWLPYWFIGSFIAGTFDICYATGFSYWRSGVAPARVLRFVASGLLGASAAQGGAAVPALGLALHYLIAFIVGAVFFGAVMILPGLIRTPVVTGALYGLAVYGVMNYVVMPLSKIGPRPTPPAIVWGTGVLVHMFLIGVPIALAARRAFARA